MSLCLVIYLTGRRGRLFSWKNVEENSNYENRKYTREGTLLYRKVAIIENKKHKVGKHSNTCAPT